MPLRPAAPSWIRGWTWGVRLTPSGRPCGESLPVQTASAGDRREHRRERGGTQRYTGRVVRLRRAALLALVASFMAEGAGAQTPILCGDPVAGSIDTPGEFDLFSFEGTTGDDIFLTLVQTGGFTGFFDTAQATLFDPDSLQVDQFGAHDSRRYALEKTGTYTVRVRANDLVGTGQYNLGRQCLDPLDPVVATLACGSLVPGNIDAPGKAEFFTFEGTVGDDVFLTLVQTGAFTGFFDTAQATLFDPDSLQVDQFDAHDSRRYALEKTGTYTVRVRANDLVGTGQYNLGLECLVPLSPFDPLPCAVPREASIDDPGEVAFFTFDEPFGGLVTLTLVQTGGFTGFFDTAQATLFDPNNLQVGEPFDANQTLVFTLLEAGTYVVRARANDLVGTGTYSLTHFGGSTPSTTTTTTTSTTTTTQPTTTTTTSTTTTTTTLPPPSLDLDLIDSPDDATAAAELVSALLAQSSGIQVVPGSAAFVGRRGDGVDPNTAQSALYRNLELVHSLDGTTIRIPDGIFLTSGVANIPFTNNFTQFDHSAAGVAAPATGSDLDLVAILLGAGAPSSVVNDANSLRFEFTVAPGFDGVRASFVFASDEFPDQGVTDVFGFFVDGSNFARFPPDPANPNGTLVSFVRDGNARNFNENAAGQYAIEYDGISNRLTVAGALNSELPTHTLKVSIADTSDSIFDSGVFIAALRACRIGIDCQLDIPPVHDEALPVCAPLTRLEDGSFLGSAADDRPSEDSNGNRILDTGEDLDGDGFIDEDTGINSVTLADGSVNLRVTPDDTFMSGDPTVEFRVDRINPTAPASGSVQVEDGAGNPCSPAPIDLPGEAIRTDGWPEEVKLVESGESSLLFLAEQEAGLEIRDRTSTAPPVRFQPPAGLCPGLPPHLQTEPRFFADGLFVWPDGSRVLLAAGRCGAIDLNVNDLQHQRIALPSWTEDADVVGNLAFFATQFGGLQIVDLDDRSIVGSVKNNGFGEAIAVDARIDDDGELRAYVATTKGLRIVETDGTPPNVARWVGRLDTAASVVPQDVAVVSELGRWAKAYVPAWQAGLLVVDVLSPEIQLMSCELPSCELTAPLDASIPATYKVAVAESESRAYVTHGLGGLGIYAIGAEGGLSLIPNGVRAIGPEQPLGSTDCCWAWSVDASGEEVVVGFGEFDANGDPVGGFEFPPDARGLLGLSELGCGFLGIEAWLVLLPLFWWRHRRTRFKTRS